MVAALLRGREPAQFLHGRGRDAATRDVLRDPVSEHGGAVLKIEQVEPAEHRAIVADEHVEDARASLLLAALVEGRDGREPATGYLVRFRPR